MLNEHCAARESFGGIVIGSRPMGRISKSFLRTYKTDNYNYYTYIHGLRARKTAQLYFANSLPGDNEIFPSRARAVLQTGG
jgi:hypothetical protein